MSVLLNEFERQFCRGIDLEAQCEPPPRRRALTVSNSRALYRGLMPNCRDRYMGGYALYVALTQPFTFALGASMPREAHVAVAQPYTLHSVDAPNAPILCVLIEQETVESSTLPQLLRGEGMAHGEGVSLQLSRAFASLPQFFNLEQDQAASDVLDIAMFGSALPHRDFSPRVRATISKVVEKPAEPHSAESCAAAVNLSTSRFLHLFKEQVDTPFRRFKAWKRARKMLAMSQWCGNLTDMALNSGYADSSHFSHSIRDTFGFSPSTIVRSLQSRPALHGSASPGRA